MFKKNKTYEEIYGTEKAEDLKKHMSEIKHKNPPRYWLGKKRAITGKKISETRKLRFQSGEITPTWLGKTRPKSLNSQQSEKMKTLYAGGEITAWNKGKPATEEERQRLTEVRRAYLLANPNSPKEVGKKLKLFYMTHPNARIKASEKRKNQIFPIKDTLIEQKIQQQLDNAELEYIKHHPIQLSNKLYPPCACKIHECYVLGH